MNEQGPSREKGVPVILETPVNTKVLAEGVSTGWESESRFTAEDVATALRGLFPEAKDARVTDRTMNHEGVLIALSMRAPGSPTGYEFVLKGKHGKIARTRTLIDRIDYKGPDSNETDWSEEIMQFKNGKWEKS